ncbi:MAG: DUF1993 domain-containing protein [Rhodospirillaceae bacterium]|jgi:uncharacterized protein|nr:DUF1993 domain-containing protein [Rhodospirillaceae bacterium]
MGISIYNLVRTETEQLLTAMLNVLDHAEGLVKEGKVEEDKLMGSSLSPDMFSFSMQVWRAADHGRAASRLAGRDVPAFTEMGELSIRESRDLIKETLSLLQSVSENELDGAEEKTIEIIARGEPTRFKGQDYLLRIAIPQIAFHVTTAYGIVRQAGAELGKRHYLNSAFDYTLS